MPNSPLASFAVWVLVLAILPILVALVLFGSSNFVYLPDFPMITALEKAVALQPRLAVYLLIWLFLLILLSCGITVWVANRKFRRQFVAEHKVYPLLPPAAKTP